ncbi:MAG: NADH-quinone oxidoreductase subunit NuoH [Deltaproteobacteria bacterium]|jgi:NADH-quinone oxidoreductase subunit H|nr:NADH-quinone oxidoreductase subunit NuoH [Deltaproteobacteria bacterium]
MELTSIWTILYLVAALVVILGFIAGNAMALVWLERKVAGFVQRRPGPNEAGPMGILQTALDSAKLITKQIVRPTHSDPIIFWLAPILAFFPVALLFMPIPFSPFFTAYSPDLGLLLILAFAGINVLSILLAGWSSNNKYGLYGAARGVSQSVAYEIPLLLAVLAIALQHGSLNLSEIVAEQGTMPWSWNFATQPLAFLIYFISMFGETNRAPFDLPEAESELTGGFHTEYSGMGFALFFLAEYANMVLVCCICTALFLGGWHGPFVDGFWWFLAKTYGLMLIIMWVRWTYPRTRFDMLLNLNWKWLLPLGALNLLATAFIMKL